MRSLKPSPCGAPEVPFLTLLVDTVLEHGPRFATAWLRGLAEWERAFWLSHPEVVRARYAWRGLARTRG